jgi:hypothetical protein
LLLALLSGSEYGRLLGNEPYEFQNDLRHLKSYIENNYV